MERDSNRHPDAEILAAFVAGNLTETEREMTVEHLRDCEDCRLVVAKAARFDREENDQTTVVEFPRRRRPWWLRAAAAAFFGLALLSYWFFSLRTDAAIPSLIAAAPRDARYLESRLSGGFPWAPLRTFQRDGERNLDPAQMKLVGVAGKVLEKNRDKPTVEAQHASAVASLLAGDPKAAVTRLEKAASGSSDPQIWSDLAAARYEVAVRLDDPRQLAEALAAADASLNRDPRFPEALFNRSLILERLGLREQARAAWQRYLAVDGSSEWAHEAQQHLQALNATVEFRKELEDHYSYLAGDAKAAAMLVQRYPQDARVWGESEILSRWARQEIDGNVSAAKEHLQLARSFGDELARRGERMLQAQVSTIDAAGNDRRKILAGAHIQFREAQRTFGARNVAGADRMFRTALAGFEAAESPMTLLARYFVANTTFELGRIEEARAELKRVLGDLPPEYLACKAHVEWQLGLIHALGTRWSDSMRLFNDSISIFERLGEIKYAMTVREILAEVYDRIGEPREAWAHRILALRELGRSDGRRLHVAVHAIARGAALNRDWLVSLAFLNLQMEMKRYDGDELMYVTTLLTRARIQRMLGDLTLAKNDLARASAAMSRVTDRALWDAAEAERLAVQSFLASSPVESIALLSKAIAFQHSRETRMLLPELLLQRGRAYRADGAPEKAAADFDAGVRELETQRMSIEAFDERWGMFGAADELFDEAVMLALERHDDIGAYVYSERARAREVLDARGVNGIPEPPQRIAGDAVVFEYLVLPHKLVIFVLDGSGVRAVHEEVSSDILAEEVRLLQRTGELGTTEEWTRAAGQLYDRLVAPVSEELATGRTLIVVPDEVLSVVPFAALVDPAGRFLIERRAVVVTPSVTAFARIAAGRRLLGKTSRLLIVAGAMSRQGDPARLTAAAHEIDAVAAEYVHDADLAPRLDDVRSLERRAATADVIHFVGHAVVPDGSSPAALVTSRREGLETQLDAREIATMRLRRTSVVVLAACGTARGHGRTGEASVSMARAFLAAGASSVAATLWPINDGPATEFFPRLHHYLALGLPPAEALRAAQLEWVHRRDAPPGVWAAVQIIGS
jgi:CHAT domain-containing protein